MKDYIVAYRPWSVSNIHRVGAETPEGNGQRRPYKHFARIYECCFCCPLADCKFQPATCKYCIEERRRGA